MKTKIGFVSNSSSTSFVLVARRGDYYKAIENLPSFVGRMTDRLCSETLTKLSGLDYDMVVRSASETGEEPTLEDFVKEKSKWDIPWEIEWRGSPVDIGIDGIPFSQIRDGKRVVLGSELPKRLGDCLSVIHKKIVDDGGVSLFTVDYA